jgi:PqqD family protein of HPr-rel-A system
VTIRKSIIMASIFHAPNPADLAPPVELEGFTLFYHRPSGQTHMLTEPAPEILAALAEASATPPEMLARLARDHGLDVEGDAEAVVAERMAELAALGLITAA